MREAALASLFSGVTTTGQSPADVAGALRLPRAGRFVVVASDSWPVEGDSASATAERALASLGVRPPGVPKLMESSDSSRSRGASGPIG